jgi:hypothetical protein
VLINAINTAITITPWFLFLVVGSSKAAAAGKSLELGAWSLL